MEHSLGKHILKLTSSRLAIQVMVFLTAPVITRLFTPEHFGVMQVFLSLAGPLIMTASLRYELSIPLAATPQEAGGSFILSVLCIVSVSFISFIGFFLGKTAIATWFHSPELASILLFLPFFVFLSSLGDTLRYWSAQAGKFTTMASADLGNSCVERIGTMAWGYLATVSPAGLLCGRFLGVLIYVTIFLHTLKRHIITAFTTTNVPFLRRLASQHKKFPLYSTWSELLTSISLQFPAIILGLYFSPKIVGYYSLARKMSILPAELLGRAIEQVFFPAAAKEYRETGTLSEIVRNVYTRLVQLIVFPMMSLWLFGGPLFSLVFGANWAEAGKYAQILAIWRIVAFINTPLKIFDIVNRQESQLIVIIIMTTSRILGLFIGVQFGNPRLALWIYNLVSAVTILATIAWKLKLAGVPIWWAFRTLLFYSISCGVLLTPAKALIWTGNSLWFWGPAIALAGGSYGLLLLWLDPSIRAYVNSLMR